MWGDKGLFMTVLDYEYSRHVGYALSASEGAPQSKLLKLYAVLVVLATAIGAGLAFAF